MKSNDAGFKATPKSMPPLSMDEVNKHLSSTTLRKARAYASDQRVSQLDWDPEQMELQAAVRGTRKYRVTIWFVEDDDQLRMLGNECTCPLIDNCKHVGATLLSVTTQHPRSRVKAQVMSKRMSKSDTPKSVVDEDLDSLFVSLYDENPTPKGTHATMGLWFQHMTRARFIHHPGNRPEQYDETVLTVRVCYKMPDDKKWLYGSPKWRDFYYQGSYVPYLPKQSAWAQKFYRAHLNSDQTYYYRHNGDKYLYLDDMDVPDIGSLLIKAMSLGIVFLCGDKKPDTPATLNATIIKPKVIVEQQNDHYIVSSDLDFSGQDSPQSISGFLGSPATLAYAFTMSKKNRIEGLNFYTIDGKLTPALLNMIVEKKSLKLDEQQFQHFKRKALSKLVKQTNVYSNLDLDIEKMLEPKLHLDLSFQAKTKTVSARIYWKYGDAPYGIQHSQQDDFERDAELEGSILQPTLAAFSGYEPNPWVDIDNVDTAPIRHNVQFAGMDIVTLKNTVLPELSNIDNLVVSVKPSIPDFTASEFEPEVIIRVSDDPDSTDWFDLGVNIKLGEHEISFEEVFVALDSDLSHLLLDNGEYLPLNHTALDKLKQLISEAKKVQQKTSGALKISRFQIDLWQELSELGVVEKQSQQWSQNMNNLTAFEQLPDEPLAPNFNAKLRAYQQIGYNWLCFIWRNQLGGILADDMGLGKTVQAIALIARMIEEKPTSKILIIAPTSVCANWHNELDRFASGVTTVHVQESASKKTSKFDEDTLHSHNIIITSYALFRRDADIYSSATWDLAIFDEAQFIKNYQTKGYVAARKLKAGLKLALTGTPFENNLMELWSLLSVVSPGLFPRPDTFKEYFQDPIEKENKAETLQLLRRRIRPLMLRRTKEVVADDLPPKLEQVLELQLNPKHRKAYDIHLQHERRKILGLADDMNKNRFAIFQSLMSLRQLSLDPKLVDAKKHAKVPSTKADALIDLLNPIISEGHRALIFSQFTGFLKSIRTRFEEEGIAFSYLDGATRNRAAVINGFKESDIPVFLISLKAGGFGLNLTEADYCFVLDPWWNPAVEAQAVDRSHRIGQTRQVMVYRLVSKATIEEKVMALKERKAKLFSNVFEDGDSFASQLTADDIRGLFD